MQKQITIAITGGHLTPALSLIDELKKQWPNQIIFIGRHLASEETNTLSHEQAAVTAKGVYFVAITTGKLYRHFSVQAALSLLKIPLGFIHSLTILRRCHPRIVVSFGGYVALPVALAAWVLRIPVVTHEQGTRVGLANKLVGLLARRIAISWPHTPAQFPPQKIILTPPLLKTPIL